MDKKSIFFSLLLSTATLGAMAQQDPLYSQYMFNTMAVNPAYAGFNETVNVTVDSRFQWGGLEGSPTTNTLSANTSFFDGNAGVGMLLMLDQLGINKNTEGYVTYAYHIRSSSSSLSFGLQTGFTSRTFDYNELNLRVNDDPFFDNTFQPKTSINFGAGAIYSTEKFMIGLSVPRLLENDIIDDASATGTTARHYYLQGAFILDIGPELLLKPSALIKSVPSAPLSMDLNANIMYRNMYWGGVFTRNLKTLGIMAQVEFADAYRFGYSFELLTGGSTNINALSTHEFVLSIDFAIFEHQDIYQRYF